MEKIKLLYLREIIDEERIDEDFAKEEGTFWQIDEE